MNYTHTLHFKRIGLIGRLLDPFLSFHPLISIDGRSYRVKEEPPFPRTQATQDFIRESYQEVRDANYPIIYQKSGCLTA